MMFARCGVRILNFSYCLLLAAIFSTSVYSAPKWDTPAATKAFEDALKQKIRLEQSPQSPLEQYRQCARTFRKVYMRDAHYTHAGDAIYEEALVYQQMGERFGDPEHFKTAIRRFEFLVSDYGGNIHCPDALSRIAFIYSNIFKDDVAAENANKKLRTRYKRVSPYIPPAKTAVLPQSPPQEAPLKLEPEPGKAIESTTVHSIRYFANGDLSRIMIDLEAETSYHRARLTRPDRIYFDISNARLSANFVNRVIPVESEHLSKIRVSQNRSNEIRVVLDVEPSVDYSVSEMRDPFRIVIDLRRRGITAKNAPISNAPKPQTANPTPVPQQQQAALNAEPASAAKKSAPALLSPPVIVPPPIPEGEKRQAPKAITRIGPVPASASKSAKSSPPDDLAPTSSSTIKNDLKIETAPPVQADRRADSSQVKLAESLPASLPPEASTGSRSLPPKGTKQEPQPEKSKAIEPKVAGKTPEASKAMPPATTADAPPVPKIAPKTSRGDRTMTRMLGLKVGRIVLDPGHGGHDLGTIGPKGLAEKTLTLAIARELQVMLEEELGADVLLTRTEDVYVPLEERTALANQHRADLFLSIHANSSQSRSISGVETYYLDFAKTNAEREIAARENATSVRNVSELEDLLKKIVQADKSAESRELASIIQKQLFVGAKKLFPSTNNRGVRSAPFIVLIGANMPSILAEVAFISNPRDERLLNKKANQKSLAKALFSGIVGYMETLGSDLAHNQSIPQQ